jgi:hypothetical protein
VRHTHEDQGLGILLAPSYRPLTARSPRQRLVRREYKRPEQHRPMYRLWASIISQAITDIREGAKSRSQEPVERSSESAKAYQRRREKWQESAKTYDEAKAWLCGQSQGGLTFADLCTALNLRPDAILARLRKELNDA